MSNQEFRKMMYTSTPSAQNFIDLCGRAGHIEAVSLTSDECHNLHRAYDVKLTGESILIDSGSTRNVFRFAAHDGVRVIALLSRYLEVGEDPVKLVLRLLMNAGYDCPEPQDNEWANDWEDWENEEDWDDENEDI